jgi:hypothetical protein
MKEFAIREFGPNDYRSKIDYAQGDVNITLIRTEQGRTITLWYNTNSPRVKEHLHCASRAPRRLQQPDGRSLRRGRSNRSNEENFRGRHECGSRRPRVSPAVRIEALAHPAEEARGSGHGGGDYFELSRLIANLRAGRPLDIDVYDAAAWSALSPLSEASVAGRSKPVEIPDFTRGKWKLRRPSTRPDRLTREATMTKRTRRDILPHYSRQRARSDARPIRAGIVGVGDRGSITPDLLLGTDLVEVPAICDINPDCLYRAKR